MICLYHTDNDGMCAGNWVNQLAPRDRFPDAFIPMDYSPEFTIPWNDIHADEYVYIVDFSIEPSQMSKLLQITLNVIWIDHHKTAIDKYKDFNINIKGIRNTNHSGCMLTWWYLQISNNGQQNFNDYQLRNAPEVTKLIDDWDMWRFKYKETRAFNEGFISYIHEPQSKIWKDLDINKNKIIDIVSEGNIIINYRNNLMKNLILEYGFESRIDGYSAFCFNQGNISSFDFESIDMDKYDLVIGFIFNGNEYQYSLRTTKNIDVSKIATKYGGGGHPKAAGFHHKDLIL